MNSLGLNHLILISLLCFDGNLLFVAREMFSHFSRVIRDSLFEEIDLRGLVGRKAFSNN